MNTQYIRIGDKAFPYPPKFNYWLRHNQDNIKEWLKQCKMFFDNPSLQIKHTDALEAKEWELFNQWLSSGIKISDELKDVWKDGEAKVLEKDFELEGNPVSLFSENSTLFVKCRTCKNVWPLNSEVSTCICGYIDIPIDTQEKQENHLGESTNMVSKVKNQFEIFCDSSYFDLWAIRPKGEARFGVDTIHVTDEKSANDVVMFIADMVSRIVTAQVSDTTEGDSSNADDNKK
jgi:hypothetical protein